MHKGRSYLSENHLYRKEEGSLQKENTWGKSILGPAARGMNNGARRILSVHRESST